MTEPGPARFAAPTPGPERPTLPAGPVLPFEPPVPVREYQSAYRIPQVAGWKPVIMVVVAAALWFAVQLPLSAVGVGLDIATGRKSVQDIRDGNLVGPFLLAANNLCLAALIVIAMFVQQLFTGQPAGFLSSVRGRFRWGWLLRSALVILPLWGAWMGLSELLAPSPRGESTDVVLLIAITLLTTPVQAAGEEYGFRGLVNRCTAAYFSNPRVGLVLGAVVSSLLFMAAHAATDVWLLLYYFGFGMLMCLITWRTGGLESAVLIHTLNNVVAFVLLALTGGTDQVFQRQSGAGSPGILVSLLIGLVVALAVEWLARRVGLIRVGRPGVGEGAEATQPAVLAHQPRPGT